MSKSLFRVVVCVALAAPPAWAQAPSQSQAQPAASAPMPAQPPSQSQSPSPSPSQAQQAAAPSPAAAAAAAIGKIRTLSGEAAIERAGQRIPAALGATVQQADRIVTGPNGSVGLLFDDDSRLAVGPNSTLSLDRFVFDPATQDGAFDVSMRKGTLSVVSGRMTAKRPGALRVRTQAAVLAVRGTEFSVRIDEPDADGPAR